MKLDYETLDWTTIAFTFEDLLGKFTPEERDELYTRVTEHMTDIVRENNWIMLAETREWLDQIKRHEPK